MNTISNLTRNVRKVRNNFDYSEPVTVWPVRSWLHLLLYGQDDDLWSYITLHSNHFIFAKQFFAVSYLIKFTYPHNVHYTCQLRVGPLSIMIPYNLEVHVSNFYELSFFLPFIDQHVLNKLAPGLFFLFFFIPAEILTRHPPSFLTHDHILRPCTITSRRFYYFFHFRFAIYRLVRDVL